MKSVTRRRSILPVGIIASALCLLPEIAAAHPGHYHPPGEEDEFDALSQGFLHPLGGLDHLVLAVAIGWFAFAWKGGKARIPALFFLMSLVIGSLIGHSFHVGHLLEVGLSLTLMISGSAFLSDKPIRASYVATASAACGFLHGFAHGAEATSDGGFAAYACGFLVSTTVLASTGLALGFGTAKVRDTIAPRFAGLAIVVFGTISLFQAI